MADSGEPKLAAKVGPEASAPGSDAECFYIAPIGHAGSESRIRSDKVLRFIVAPAAEELGLTALRADSISQPGQITLQVIEHLLKAKAVVADLTEQNPNVFYELAVRHTIRQPVVLICEDGTSLPFDTSQMRTIFFRHNDLESADDCRQSIVAQLREAFGGHVESPVSTSVDLADLRAGSSTDKSLAELITTVGNLSSEFGGLRMDMFHMLEDVMRRPTRARTEPRAVEDAWDRLRAVADYAEKSGDKDLQALVSRVEAPIDFLMFDSRDAATRARRRETVAFANAAKPESGAS